VFEATKKGLEETKKGACAATKREALEETKRGHSERQKGGLGLQMEAWDYKMGSGLKAHGNEQSLKIN
jgi:hypothetical protein